MIIRQMLIINKRHGMSCLLCNVLSCSVISKGNCGLDELCANKSKLVVFLD